MNNKEYRVHVIVDLHYGERIFLIPVGEPAWVIDSEANYEPIRSLWKKRKAPEGGGITAFKFYPDGNPEDWFIDQMYDIDLHHGEYSHQPPYSVLNVVGVNWSDQIASELKKYGFTEYEITDEGFITKKEK